MWLSIFATRARHSVVSNDFPVRWHNEIIFHVKEARSAVVRASQHEVPSYLVYVRSPGILFVRPGMWGSTRIHAPSRPADHLRWEMRWGRNWCSVPIEMFEEFPVQAEE